MRVVVGESALEQAKKYFPKTAKIRAVSDLFFKSFPNFCIFDKKYAFVFVDAEDVAVYTENQKIINMLLTYFDFILNKCQKRRY